MRKILATAATLGLAGLGAIVPATSAQASTACDNAWRNATSGYVYAYKYINCDTYLGRDIDEDSNWADSSGGFQGSDNNNATSVLHKGTSGMAVKFYDHVNYSGGHTCLKKSEVYMDSLGLQYFTSYNGTAESANNDISSHNWVWESACSKFLDS